MKSARERDLRIDFIRGLALLIIFVDHNAFLDRHTFGWVTAFTLGRFSFIDAADVFFFISGYVSGLIYTNVFLSKGLLTCLRKALKRCFYLYIAEVTLFLFCSVLILSAPLQDTAAPWAAFHRLRDLPSDTLRATLTLTNPPPFFGLLPIYMLFIGLTPIAIWLRSHRPVIIVAISAGLYLIAQSASGLQAYTYADGFNPFAWQLLFFGGVLIGFGMVHNPGRRWNPSSNLVAAAAVGLLLIGLLRLGPSERLGTLFHTGLLTHILPNTIPFTGKQNFEPLRIVNLGLWLIVVAAVNPGSAIFKKWAVRMLIMCGQNSLFVFCASVFLNYVVLIYARAANGGKILQLAWNVIGCGALIGAAAGWRRLTGRVGCKIKTNFTNYGVPIYLNRGLQQVGVLIYAAWQAFQGFGGNGPDV